jgi:hypothetical protein
MFATLEGEGGREEENREQHKKTRTDLGGKGQQVTGNRTNLGQSKHNAPEFLLVSETVLTDELQLAVQAFLFERTTRSFESGGVQAIVLTHLMRGKRIEIGQRQAHQFDRSIQSITV